MARRIKLYKYGYTVVDDEDYEWLSAYKWHMNHQGYIITSYVENGKTVTRSMHRMIMGDPKGMDVEHENLVRQDNRRSENLRIATRSQNMANIPARRGNKHSKYKGVSLLKRENLKKPWLAYLRKNYKTTYLGYFATQEEAAEAYNKKAIEVFGEFAQLNVIDPPQE